MKRSQGPVLDFIFKYAFYLVNFFITIGQVTEKIIYYIFVTPYKVILFIGKNILKLLIFLFSKLEKINFPKKPKINIPKIYFPKIKLPKINLPKLPKYLYKISLLKLRYFFSGVLITLMMVFLVQTYYFVKQLPSPMTIGKVNYPLSTHIYDRNGKLLYEIYRSQNRTPISLKNLPSYVSQATIAIEDKNFYRHSGVALISGILRAVKENILNKKLQGGSTITQQLVKSALLSPEKTVIRKVKEIILALWTEKIYTKDKILEMYLNQVPYGGSSYGIEEASKTYFGKSAKNLTIDEAALLAGLPQAPSIYSPYNNPEAALRRRNEVLQAMKDQGYIDEKSKIKYQNVKMEVLPPMTSIRAPHFVFYTKSMLEEMYGISTVEEGGLKVTTTLDINIQEEAEKILQEELDKISYLNVTNGAILVTRPSTGEILAMVGSKDYFSTANGAFNVTTALRQPGSSIKPIMYSLALEKGYTAATIIDDTPVVFNIAGSESYRPVNYDGKFHGKIPLRLALANSYNIPAVKVLEKIGVSDFIDFAKKLGINTWTDKSRYGLSLTLGGGEVTMLNMAESFGVLANNGYKLPINSYLKIESNEGAKLKELIPFKIKEIDSGIAYIVSDILSDNFARQYAFGPGSTLEIPGYKVAVKTGTTNDKKDNWTIGYTPDFLVTVWVGNNDNTPMNPYLTSGITGASPIWNRVMGYLLKNYSKGNNWYQKPEDIVEKRCYFGRIEYFIKGTENKASCSDVLFGVTPTPTP